MSNSVVYAGTFPIRERKQGRIPSDVAGEYDGIAVRRIHNWISGRTRGR